MIKPGKQRRRLKLTHFAAALSLACLLAGGYLSFGPPQSYAIAGTSFSMCSRAPRDDCVIDGDTFYFRGEKIRIADIDAPETHPPRCDYEARLGAQATRRLLDLLNAGPFELQGFGSRDRDRYGRELRIVVRNGRSIGGMLVSEGLARKWTGRRMPWCN